MGYSRRPYFDTPVAGSASTDSRFAAAGLVYVCCSLAFIVLAVTIAVALGSRFVDLRMLSFGIAGVAAILFSVGVSLLTAFFFRHFASRPAQEFSDATSKSGDLWDDQLDG